MAEPQQKKAKVSPEPAPEKANTTSPTSSSTTDEYFGSDYIGSDYTGLVITCIRVQSNDGNNNIVEFTETDGCGDEAIFLTNLTELKGRSSVRKFRATKLTVDEAKELIRNPPKPPGVGMSDESWKLAFRDAIPLFCFHGFDVEPSDLFDSMEKRNRYSNKERHVQELFAEQEGKYYPVLALWPSSIFGLVTYKVEQEKNALEAQKVFRAFTDTISNAAFPLKSLMIHSMGGHLVLNGACSGSSPPAIDFDDIFMVAADVDFDVFHTQPDEISDKDKPKRAKHFFSMLRTEAVVEEEIHTSDSSIDDTTITTNTNTSSGKEPQPVGKVHILHNVDDVSLLLSTTSHHYSNCTAFYCINKLGQRGNGMYTIDDLNPTEWRGDRQEEIVLFPNSYVNVDCSSQTMYSRKMKHSYQFDEFAIAYYCNPEAHGTNGDRGHRPGDAIMRDT